MSVTAACVMSLCKPLGSDTEWCYESYLNPPSEKCVHLRTNPWPFQDGRSLVLSTPEEIVSYYFSIGSCQCLVEDSETAVAKQALVSGSPYHWAPIQSLPLPLWLLHTCAHCADSDMLNGWLTSTGQVTCLFGRSVSCPRWMLFSGR